MSDEPTGAESGFSRRRFLSLTGVSAAGAAVSTSGLARIADPRLAAGIGVAVLATTGPSYVITQHRPADQLVLTLSFWNLVPDFTHSPPVLRRKDPKKANYLSVVFGRSSAAAPMSVAEHAFPLSAADLDPSAQKPPAHGPKAAITPVPHHPSAPVANPPIGARIAGQSRLVFHVPNSAVAPAAAHPMTLDSASLLNWLDFVLSVAPNAVGVASGSGALSFSGLGAPKAPTSLQTAIEMPYRLVISPPATPVHGIEDPNGGHTVFVNAVAPVTHGAWTELWHTRLAMIDTLVIGDPGKEQVVDRHHLDETSPARTIRAIWCTDSAFAADVKTSGTHLGNGDQPFRSSLNYNDRYDLVRLTSDFRKKHGPFHRDGFLPSPASVDLLMLSSLGGWLEADGHWNLQHSASAKDYNSSLLSWRHRAVQGRDAYVRVVRKGYLFPWGHQASLITVTEREPTAVGSTVGAYLRQKTFIVVSKPVKAYGGPGDVAPYAGRNIPFTSVEALTLVTPDLAKPTKYTHLAKAEKVFKPKLDAKTPFLFHFRGTDWAGDTVDFRSPVLWVDDTEAYGDHVSHPVVADIITRWRAEIGTTSSPVIDLHSKRVSLAKPKSSTVTGDTQVVVATFVLGVDHPAGSSTAAHRSAASQPDFYPALSSVLVQHPEAQTASGNPVDGSTLEYEVAHYLANGFTGNHGGVFLQRVPTSDRKAITFKGDKSGGAVTPNLGIDGFSREIGPASGDLALLAAGKFDAKAVFAGVQAKLLGGLELSTILGLVGFGDAAAQGNAQALQLTSVQRSDPPRIVTTLDWHPVVVNGGPTLKVGGQSVTVQIFEVQESDGDYPVSSAPNADTAPGSSDSMDLHAVIVTDLVHPANSTTSVSGQIRAFNLNLFGKDTTFFIQIPFDSLTFRAHSGQKTDVDVQIGSGGVQFEGPLSFVQDLATYLNFGGSGLVIDTSGSAITAVLTLAIPSLSVGVFGLENLAFSAGVAIPYNGDPVRFTFAFCSRENPFQLEIMMFTGGGYVGIGIGADGVEMLEFGFDFGLGISIDVGVASGQVSLLGGLSYESQKDGNGFQDVKLTAYVKASGGVSALGIISVSVELYLTLGYEHDAAAGTTQVMGSAEMSISVHILFFGGTVGFSVHKTFGGSHHASPHASPHLSPNARPALARPNDDPAPPADSFASVMTQADWDAYCTSFALVGVGS